MHNYTLYTDVELTGLLKSGDHAAFTEIFNRYSPVLYSHAYKKLNDKDEAREVIQDTFVRFWAKYEELDLKTNLSGYLYTMVRNGVINVIRHKETINHYAESYSQFQEKSYAVTDHLIREKQFKEIIDAEIAALPPRMREVFMLRQQENMSNRQIAERLGISEHTVADQMKKALRYLRVRIGLMIIVMSWFNS